MKINLKPRTLFLLLFMSVLFSLVEVVAIYQLNNETAKRAQLIAKNADKASVNASNMQIMKQFEEQVPKLNQAIPQESQFPEIVEKIDSRISIYPDSNFKFDSNSSVTAVGESHPHFLVTITAVVPSLEEIENLIRDLSINSFLFTAQDIDINRRPDNQNFKITIKGRLYGQQIN